MSSRCWHKTTMLGLLLSAAGVIAASAGSVEVVVRDRDGDAVSGEHVFLRVVTADANDPRTEMRLRRGYLSARTGFDGKTRFDGSRGLIRLTAAGDRSGREILFDVSGFERIDLEARMKPAASRSVPTRSPSPSKP
ncbi:MAG: hypothetical protein V3T72_20375 [Thermoanaerobaculia bacterium]